jgi:hypothetical protein
MQGHTLFQPHVEDDEEVIPATPSEGVSIG